MKTFFLLFSLAFATVFLLNLGLPSVATTTGKKEPFDPIWHRIKITRVLKSWSVYNVRHSLCIGFAFQSESKQEAKWLPYSECHFPCMQAAKQMLHFSWDKSKLFPLCSLLFSIFWHSASINNSKWSFIFYAKVKSWHARIERHFFPSPTLSVGNHEYA